MYKIIIIFLSTEDAIHLRKAYAILKNCCLSYSKHGEY